MHQHSFVCGFNSFFLTSGEPSRGRCHPRSPAPPSSRRAGATSSALDLPVALRTPARSTALPQRHPAFSVSAARCVACGPVPPQALPPRIAAECLAPCLRESRTLPLLPHRSSSAHPHRLSTAPVRVRSFVHSLVPSTPLPSAPSAPL